MNETFAQSAWRGRFVRSTNKSYKTSRSNGKKCSILQRRSKNRRSTDFRTETLERPTSVFRDETFGNAKKVAAKLHSSTVLRFDFAFLYSGKQNMSTEFKMYSVHAWTE